MMNFQIASLIFAALRYPEVTYTSDKIGDIPPGFLSLQIPGESGDDNSSEGSSSSASKNSQLLVDAVKKRIPQKYTGALPVAVVADDEKRLLLARTEERIPQECVQPWNGINHLTMHRAQTLCESIARTYEFSMLRKVYKLNTCYPKFHRRRDSNNSGGNLLVYMFLHSGRKGSRFDADVIKCFCDYYQVSGPIDSFLPDPESKKIFFLMKFSSNEYAVLVPQNSIRSLGIIDFKEI